MGKQATSHARHFVAREGTARRAWDPPVRYPDKPLRPSLGATSLNLMGVQFLMAERVQYWTSVDKRTRFGSPFSLPVVEARTTISAFKAGSAAGVTLRWR